MMEAIELINRQISIEKIFDLLDITETTRQDYKYRIGLFLDFIRDNGLNRNSFLEFKRYLSQRADMSVSSKNKYLATARVFLKEASRQGVLPADITLNIKSFKQDKKHKRDGLTQDEISKLTKALKELPSTDYNIRLKAIISLLVLQGLRQIEITRLDVSDIDFANKTIFVRGKGRDDKEPMYLHPEAVIHLQDYVKATLSQDGALFTSQSNNSRGKRLTTRAIRLMVKKLLKELGIEKTTHGFRHFFTTTLIKNFRGDLLEVAKYTRHRSLEMLQVYNDDIQTRESLPRYYQAFSNIRI